jgi:hypothetical protein
MQWYQSFHARTDALLRKPAVLARQGCDRCEESPWSKLHGRSKG